VLGFVERIGDKTVLKIHWATQGGKKQQRAHGMVTRAPTQMADSQSLTLANGIAGQARPCRCLSRGKDKFSIGFTVSNFAHAVSTIPAMPHTLSPVADSRCTVSATDSVANNTLTVDCDESDVKAD
jgi:hypothetical protein